MTVPPPGPSSGPNPPPQPGRTRLPWWTPTALPAVVIGSALIALVTSCGTDRPDRDTDSDGDGDNAAPVAAVRDLLDADISGDDAGLRAASCRADVEGDDLGTGSGAPIDGYTIGDVTEGNAGATIVSVRVTTAGDSFTIRLPVIQEDGQHKVCNSVASDAIP